MDFFALGVAIVALLIALSARKSSGQQAALDDLRSDGRRRVDNLAEELRTELETTRRLLAEVAKGTPLDAEQILDGRLWNDVTPTEAAALVEQGAVDLLDVRTPQETAGGIIPGAQLIPVDQLEDRIGELPKGDRPMLIYCAGGGRSAAACEFLSQSGRAGLKNLAGGMGSWTGPVERG